MCNKIKVTIAIENDFLKVELRSWPILRSTSVFEEYLQRGLHDGQFKNLNSAYLNFISTDRYDFPVVCWKCNSQKGRWEQGEYWGETQSNCTTKRHGCIRITALLFCSAESLKSMKMESLFNFHHSNQLSVALHCHSIRITAAAQ